MTHTNHRQGTQESLKGDWIVMMLTARGINDQGAGFKLKRFLQLSLKHQPVNAGTSRIGNALNMGWQEFMSEVSRWEHLRNVTVVFDSQDKVTRFIRDVAKAELGLSVVVSGLHAEIDGICRQMGTRRHTAQYSLGVWGKTTLLPHPKIMEITTMCGHGTIPFNLVRRMAKAVQAGSLSLEQAAAELAKPCMCGVFNTTRAQALIQEYIACKNSL